MSKLFINTDGANCQAQAVLAYLRASSIEESWDKETKRYLAEPEVNRWYNCREQGYVVSLRSFNYSRQLNIAFFEHRNSDAICAIEWEQVTINPPTIDTMKTCGKVYKDKYDTSHDVNHGQVVEMADWILKRLATFWASTNKVAP